MLAWPHQFWFELRAASGRSHFKSNVEENNGHRTTNRRDHV